VGGERTKKTEHQWPRSQHRAVLYVDSSASQQHTASVRAQLTARTAARYLYSVMSQYSDERGAQYNQCSRVNLYS
jgi:hypothetical protein